MGATGAVGVVVMIWLAGVYVLCLSEPYPVLKLAFEASSALGGSGLSLGVTGDLTTMGKVVLIVLMLVGRVVPLALIYWAVADASPQVPAQMPANPGDPAPRDATPG